MATILNLILILLELIALVKVRKRGPIRKTLIYYTQLSNLLALCTSLLLVIFGQKPFVEVGRFLATVMLCLTLFVTVCILAPMSGNVKDLLFRGSSFYQHLLIPILSLLSYLFAENKAPFGWILLPITVTLLYGISMLYLNSTGRVDGPYPFFRIKQIGTKATALWMVVLLMVTGIFSSAVAFQKQSRTDVKFIFVHGLAGWGSYDRINDFFPYWGLSGGSIIRYLNQQGYESYAASVDPTGSAWDRACELYAQLSGTRVDYGAAHSAAAGHDRYGADYTGRALLKNFDQSRFALIGHSFGGATIRLFSEILRNGSEAEQAATEDGSLSPFFRGGNGDGLLALVTLSAPTNGTTAYDLYEDESFDLSSIEILPEYEKNSGAVSSGTKAEYDGRKLWDYAAYDMHIDNALALNETIHTFDDVYYFAYPFSSCVRSADGNPSPDPAITENIFMKGAIYMSRYTGSTRGGYPLDASWQENDGLVNTISAGAPFGAPREDYTENMVLTPGIWYVMPTVRGDHMSPQGGLTVRVNVKPFYLELAERIAGLAR
jgi:triacylglycerol esterase/lipase EstA (alpha/beta hydrolase family)